MEETTTGPVTLGKMPKAVEKSLKVTLPAQGVMQVTEEYASLLAKKKPDTYLKIFEEMSHIVKEPDFASYNEMERKLYLIKDFLGKDGFRKISIRFALENNAWVLDDLMRFDDRVTIEVARNSRIVRVSH